MTDTHPGTLYEEAHKPARAPRSMAPTETTKTADTPGIWRQLSRFLVPAGSLLLLFAALVPWLAGRDDLARWPLLAIIVLGGLPLAWETINQLLQGEFGVDVIAILAIGGSLALGEYLAGALVVLMLSGGEALEAYALRRARSSLKALAERAPRTAHVRQGDELITVAADSVEVDQVVVVKPGELMPVDGVVMRGSSSVSEADLTGEPLPVCKEPGALTLSGSVNLDSVLDVRATRRSAESQYAQIVRLVEAAQEHKAPIHRLADRYAVWFTALAILLAIGAWAVSGDSVYGLAVLVVATPCPLILATPIAIMSGVNLAARNGIIVKSGAAMEQLGEVDVAVFDKTGTLTLGTPRLMEIVLDSQEASETTSIPHETLLQYVASVEQFSAHILARAVVEAAREKGIALLSARHVHEVAGKGILGRIAGAGGAQAIASHMGEAEVAIGNRTFMEYLEIPLPQPLVAERERRTNEGQIASFIAVDRRIIGLIVFADAPRQDLAQLSTELKAAGIVETVLLTGDGKTVANQIGALAQVDRVVAHCLPDEKVTVVADLEAADHRVLMVGDGVNDAPALALATVGLAMGVQGLTASAAVADAILLSPDILRVVTAVRLGRRVMRIARQGIWLGIGLSIVAMIFAALGYIQPAAGAVLQEVVDVLVILNALRVGAGRSMQPGRRLTIT